MIRFNLSNTYKAPVKFVMLDENGNPETMEFQAEFQRFNAPAVKALMAEKLDDPVFARRVLKGWKLKDENGQDVEFNDVNLERVLSLAGLAGDIGMRFLETVGAARPKA